MNKKYMSFALIFCAFLCISPLYAKAKKVVVEGVGDNTPKGRQDAYNDALRKAIEKAVGTYVSVEVQVENKQLIDEKIYSRNEAYIQSAEILKKGVNKDGLYVVKVRALVKEGKIKDDIKGFEILSKRKGNPRLLVIVKVTERNRHWYTNPDASGIRSKIESRLLRKKFRLVDADQIKNIQQIEKAAAQGNATELKALAQRYGAEIIVTANAGKTFTRSTMLYGRKKDFYTLDVALKAVIADTAQMIYSDSAQTPETARFTDIHKKAETLTKDMIKTIKEKWQSDVFNETVFELMVLKATYQDLLLLKEALEYSLGVNSIIERSFAENTALLEVAFAGTSAQFGLLLADLEEPDCKIMSRSANKFKVQLVKGTPVPVKDTVPPVMKIISPKGTAVFPKTASTITVKGIVEDPEVQKVEIGNRTINVKDGSFRLQVKLDPGINIITAKGSDKAGNIGTASVTVILDDQPPYIQFRILDFEKKTFAGRIEPGSKLTVNGNPVETDKEGNFKIVLQSVFGTKLEFVVKDAAGNSTVQKFTLPQTQ